MNYTNILLSLIGFAGIVCHNLMKMDEKNRNEDGNFNYWKYFMIERFRIALSVVVVIICVSIKTEIKELELAGKWLGLSFFTIGYMAQSLLGMAAGYISNRNSKKLNQNE